MSPKWRASNPSNKHVASPPSTASSQPSPSTLRTPGTKSPRRQKNANLAGPPRERSNPPETEELLEATVGEDVATKEEAGDEVASQGATTMIPMSQQTQELPEEEKLNSPKNYALIFLPEEEARTEEPLALEDGAVDTPVPLIMTVTKYRLSKSLAVRRGLRDAPDQRHLLQKVMR